MSNIDAATLTDFRVLNAVNLPEFRQSLLEVIDNFGTDQLRNATYKYSPSFRRSETNFHDMISPFSGRLASEQHDALLGAVMANGQNWDAADTPSLLLLLLKNSDVGNLPTKEGRDEFYQELNRLGRRDRYKDVLELFEVDGWVPPPPRTDK